MLCFLKDTNEFFKRRKIISVFSFDDKISKGMSFCMHNNSHFVCLRHCHTSFLRDVFLFISNDLLVNTGGNSESVNLIWNNSRNKNFHMFHMFFMHLFNELIQFYLIFFSFK